MVSKEEKLKKVLEEFIEDTGVLGAAVVSNEGLMMASILPEDVDPPLIAAMTASLFGTSQRVVNELVMGDLEQAIVEAKKGKIIACSSNGIGIIVVLLPQNVNIGLIMLELGRVSQKVKEILR